MNDSTIIFLSSLGAFTIIWLASMGRCIRLSYKNGQIEFKWDRRKI